MNLSLYSLVLFGLLAIIPAGVVAVITLLRIESIRVTIVTLDHALKNLRTDFERSQTSSVSLLADFDRIQRKQSELEAELHGQRLKAGSLEESIASINNKMNSRERIERKQVQRREEEEDKQPPEIPGTEQQIMPLFQPVNSAPRRKFGQMP